MEIIELRRGDFIYRGAAGRGMGFLKIKSAMNPKPLFSKMDGIGNGKGNAFPCVIRYYKWRLFLWVRTISKTKSSRLPCGRRSAMDPALLDRMDVEKYLPEIRKALGRKKMSLTCITFMWWRTSHKSAFGQKEKRLHDSKRRGYSLIIIHKQYYLHFQRAIGWFLILSTIS